MTKRALTVLMGLVLSAASAAAQQKTVTGKVTSEQGAALSSVAVVIKGTRIGTSTNSEGNYSIRVEPGQVLLFRFIGTAPVEKTVGAEDVIDVSLRKVATSLEEVVVTALGTVAAQRSLGTAQQTVLGEDIAQTQRENFVNSLQGRIAGVDVTSSSGVPGSSSSITIRGVSSISSSNQPLMIIDGLPLDNKTMNTGVLASDAPGSTTAFSNRGVDFTNRAADVNPEDIETLTVLKGPEASALYGIDAANGAIVITTKRGRPGASSMVYSSSFRMERTNARPEIQKLYSPTSVTGSVLGSFQYFGAPYPAATTFYDNVDGFFQTAMTSKHNLALSGAAPDNRVNYFLSASSTKQEGVVPNSTYDRINLTGASQGKVNEWLSADLKMSYIWATNEEPYKGDNGPLLGLLVWPQTDDAKDYLTPAGTRRRLTALATNLEVDNPYFNVNKNLITSKNGRVMANLGFSLTPFSWGNLRTNIGTDAYTNQNVIVRHPESAIGNSVNGIIDQADDITRNINSQTLFNVNPRKLTSKISVSGLVGNAVSDYKSNVDALKGQDFLDPNFISVNNTNLRQNRTTIAQRRLVSAFGSATVDYNQILYLTLTGRNDWTSTIPKGANSFFYPSISSSFIFSDAFPTVGRYVTGKVRAAYAEVGKDARPYAYRPSLEYKLTSNGGYAYGFTGPNLGLQPEFAQSYEFGTDLGFFDDRLGVELTYYQKETRDQIVNDIRGSYATGYILFNLNGAKTKNWGTEVTVRGTPLVKREFAWDFLVNFTQARGKVLALPNSLPESYVSDTWLYGNVRNGTKPGLSTMSLTGFFYTRVASDSAGKKGQLLIDPTSGLPLRSSVFIDGNYDRQPDFTIGVNNTLHYKKFALDFLIDIRKGGDVFNATEHYLTVRGLSKRTLDRETPRVITGVLRDGKENSSSPTVNTIVVIPSTQPAFYTGMSEELFIEKDINWFRVRDIQLSYSLSGKALQVLRAKDASVFIKGSDLWLRTNYSGMDPIVNGNSAAVGGSGGAGIDYGNFPMPRAFNFGLRAGF